MPRAGVPVSSGSGQADREGFSWKDQPGVEQRHSRRSDYCRSGVRLGVLVHPFYCIVDSDCDSDIDGIRIGACREFCPELGQVEA